MDLLTIVTTEKTISVKDAIRNALQGLTANEQLSKLVNFFQVATERNAQLTELIAEAWDYLNANTLWNTRYSSLEVLKQDIDYDYTLRHILGRHQANVGRRKGEISMILNNWELFPDAALPSDLQPPIFSERILCNLATLSKICILETAIPLLHLAVLARRSTPSLLKHEYLHQGDVLAVIKHLKANARLQTLKPSSQLRVKAKPTTQRIEDDENGDEEDEEGNGGEEKEEDNYIETLPVPDRDDRRGFNLINAQKMMANSTQPTPITSSGNCVCPPKVVEALLNLQDNSDDKAGLQVLRLACNAGLETMCHRHLHTLSSTSVGLHNNHSNLVLTNQITSVLRHAFHLTDFKLKHHEWFRKSRRPAVDADRLAVYRYTLVALSEFTFNAAKIFERFVGAGA
ncbi:hypothetical protein FGG08_006846 [Glutinoglossum americanum]|uniref:Uncharacterized protein n=1 Tax=Glutinoglossum americanum TaxID=1670608 RepID=A0A9P8I6I2_9PEZI|nr:hypothetical protein FGG08_006846 [Glutinoglossum americanum]